MRATTAMLLRQAGHTVQEAESGGAAIRRVEQEPFDVVLTDLRMPDVDGLEVLRAVREHAPDTQVIVMTAYGTIDSAVEAMRRGAPTDATVLLTGASGTGKELVARALHASSRRSGGPFVPVNCAAITETLLESELFGHARGAFTGATKARRGLFEEAHGGTLFIGEVGETTPGFQAKLLRALQDGEIRRVGESAPVLVDVRVVAATNQDLRRAIAEKRFREDLFYRLAVVPIRIPPLRERRGDVPLLAAHFLRRATPAGAPPRSLGPDAVAKLVEHTWPGNVRELENAIAQAAALAPDPEIHAADLHVDPHAHAASAAAPRTLAAALEDAERVAIEAALARHAGDLGGVARELGVSATTLWRKMKRLGMARAG